MFDKESFEYYNCLILSEKIKNTFQNSECGNKYKPTFVPLFYEKGKGIIVFPPRVELKDLK